MALLLESASSIPGAFLAIAAAHPDQIVYWQAIAADSAANPLKQKPRRWASANFAQTRARVAAIAAALRGFGVKPGDRVAIVSNSRPEWMEADLAVLSLGGVTVSVYQSLTSHEIGYLLYDSGATIVFAENAEQVEKLTALQKEACPIPATEEREACSAKISVAKIVAFDPVPESPEVVQFESLLGYKGSEPFEFVPQIKRDDLACLVYTSGTTAAPKGVMQTHGNHLANVRQAFNAKIYSEEAKLMLFLPLAHSFAKLMGYIGFLTKAQVMFPAVADRRSSKFNPFSISKDIREAGADVVPLVPRLLEKMQAGIVNHSHGRGVISRIVRITLWAARERFRAIKEKREIPPYAGLVFGATGWMRRLLRKKLFGKGFRYAVSGGAKLPLPVAEFFESIEIEIFEGYGLTETCVATNVNRTGRKKLGTVGPVLDKDIEIRIAGDGEVLFRGPNITKAYYNRPAATAAAWDNEGWFKTGDLGSLDAQGFLSIDGRKKELIVTAGGKKIPPDPVETKIKAGGFIAQAVLVGEGRPYCCVLLTLDRERIAAWAAAKGMTLGDDAHLNEQVIELISKQIDAVNAGLASYETVKKFEIIPDEFTVENGLLTPTFKVKRREIDKRYAAQIAAFYER